jgi:hopanoid biosynthesis associated protein HpnK
MVGGPAAADAVARARRLPTLRVGLHLVLVEGWPTLPPKWLPDLVDRSGRFRTDMVRLGFDLFSRPRCRAQMAAEIEAQFAVFAATGLELDHVNAHKHFHLHPSVAQAIVAVGGQYGLRGLRVPREPAAVLAGIEKEARASRIGVATPWSALLARRARRNGAWSPDAVFGLAWSGAMTQSRLAGILKNLPDGSTEIYTHPATADDFDGHARGYRYVVELAALTSPATIAAARRPDVTLGGYRDFDPGAPSRRS